MKAVGFNTPLPIHHPDALLDINLPDPILDPLDILVTVEAVSVNPADVKIRQNHQPTTGSHRILGFDAAGTVVALGNEVTNFTVGDKVYYAGAINRMGANAQYQAVDSRIVAKMPDDLRFDEAAALPLTTLTAWEVLFDRLDVNKPVAGGKRILLVIGGAGGVGSIAIQLAKTLTDLTVVATASRPESVTWCKQMGADFVINHHDLQDEYDHLDLISPEFIFSTNNSEHNLKTIATLILPQGRLALIDDPQSFDINPFKGKSVSVHWEFMFTRSMYQTADIAEQGKILTQTAKLITQGKVKSTLARTIHGLNADSLKQAHALVERGDIIGKVVCRQT